MTFVEDSEKLYCVIKRMVNVQCASRWCNGKHYDFRIAKYYVFIIYQYTISILIAVRAFERSNTSYSAFFCFKTFKYILRARNMNYR